MPKKGFHFVFLILCLIQGTGCNSVPAKPEIRYVALEASVISDSLSDHIVNYREDFDYWKSLYNNCLHDSLFSNAFYLGLQTNMGIGGISNRVVQNIDKQITVLDTSANGRIMDILAINKAATCFSKINLNKNIQDVFYHELIANLKNSDSLALLTDEIDTSQIIFKIGTLMDYSIRPDTLVNVLERTRDTALIRFKHILMTEGNVLLIRAVALVDFYAEFHLKGPMTPHEVGKFKQEMFFKIGSSGENGSIKLLSNQNLQVHINKYYTVFAQFEVFQ